MGSPSIPEGAANAASLSSVASDFLWCLPSDLLPFVTPLVIVVTADRIINGADHWVIYEEIPFSVPPGGGAHRDEDNERWFTLLHQRPDRREVRELGVLPRRVLPRSHLLERRDHAHRCGTTHASRTTTARSLISLSGKPLAGKCGGETIPPTSRCRTRLLWPQLGLGRSEAQAQLRNADRRTV